MAPSRYHKPGLSKAYPREKASPQRAIRFVLVVAAFIVIIILLTSSPVPATVSNLPVFRPTAHQPPVQPNSTSGDTKWYSDWKWHNPFSFSITQDETRSVLPPLRTRTPIYAFYDGDADKDEATRSAEAKLLLIWRRAWWAQGFKPVVLGRAEALNNPLYEIMQTKPMEKSLEMEFFRWLAWGDMGTGILANWLVLPMGAYDDPLLSYFRRGEYPKLTRYEGLGAGLFSGDKASINAALRETLKSRKLNTFKNIIEAIDTNTFTVEAKPDAIAFYESSSMAEIYKPLVATLADDKTAGLLALAQLITSHLHLTFLNLFSSGIAVLTPYESTSSFLTVPATKIAYALTTCPVSSIPSSCPPNHPKCTPCSPISIDTPESHSNSSSLFTIGIIPHPYTLTSLLARTEEITVRHVRRDTDRDPWLYAVTQKTLGKKIGGPSRIVTFKETVASEWGVARGLWMTEDASPNRRDLEWRFGFSFGDHNSSSSSSTFLTDPLLSPKSSTPPSTPDEKATALQKSLVASALEVVQQQQQQQRGGKARLAKTRVRDAVEAWNMADTEAWRFVRAFAARDVVERKKWEAQERRYAGGGEEGRGTRWARWMG